MPNEEGDLEPQHEVQNHAQAPGPAPVEDKLLLGWLESQPHELQASLTQKKLDEFLEKAAQPRHVSGNACIKLCFFVEQCRSSKFMPIRQTVLSKSACLDLFNFYLEWNEKNQNRSMRQVLELVSSLVARNPDKETALAAKEVIAQTILTIIANQASHPLVKPAFKCLECLISKSTISPPELMAAYQKSPYQKPDKSRPNDADLPWDSFVSQVFDWMSFPDISPAAGRFLVTLFRELKYKTGSNENSYSLSWERSIRMALTRDPEVLENVKNYLFPTLFKLDRPGSLIFLEELNTQNPDSSLQDQELDAQALLKLSAFEVGKKTGLVEETCPIPLPKMTKKGVRTVDLQENILASLLCHSNDAVRSLAFSVLVSSSSPIRPFTPLTLDILQSNLHILYSETDAKIRNEVLSNSKYMIGRLRGSSAFLAREIENSMNQLRRSSNQLVLQDTSIQSFLRSTQMLLQKHENFIEWYCSFLLAELIPTASYQRHISALKAIQVLLDSGILKREPGMPEYLPPVNETVWSYQIDFFSPETIYLLLDLLVDPFEDVRSSAASILKLASPQHFGGPTSPTSPQIASSSTIKLEPLARGSQRLANEKGNPLHVSKLGDDNYTSELSLCLLTDFTRETEEFSNRSGRADYADGVAHLYDLLYHLQSSVDARLNLITQLVNGLEKKIITAEENLAQAVEDAPVHGNFAALNFVWNSVANIKLSPSGDLPREDVKKLQERILELCTRTWNVVRSILCDDSPEGHLPEDLDDIDVVDTKDILSYSFRAIHESSNLLRTIASTFKSSPTQLNISLSVELFTRIGDLSFEQLSTLRHRGAFSTVSLTFSTCCRLTSNHVDPNDSSCSGLLEIWYQGVLNCIETQVSTTRRSAGIPVLLTAIMAAFTNKQFKRVMVDLIHYAQEPVDRNTTDEQLLRQVHAINCLREVFKSSTTSSRADEYVSDCVQVVGISLRSPAWPIRNSGLLLLRSIVDVLLGTSSNKTSHDLGWNGESVMIQYDKYTALSSVLMDLLRDRSIDDDQQDVKIIDQQAHIVLPALSVIRRAGPPPEFKDEFYDLVRNLLGSSSWSIRDQAAQTLAVITRRQLIFKSMALVMSSWPRSVNESHGILLAVRYMIEIREPERFYNSLDLLVKVNKEVEQWGSKFENITLNVWQPRHPTLDRFFSKIEVQNTALLMALSQSNGEKSLSIFECTAPVFDLENPDDIISRLKSQTRDLKLWQHGPYIVACVKQAVYLSFEDHVKLDIIFKYCLELWGQALCVVVLDSVQAMVGKRVITADDFASLLALYVHWADIIKDLDPKRLMIVRISDLLNGHPLQTIEQLYSLEQSLDRLADISGTFQDDSTFGLQNRSYLIAQIRIQPYWLRVKAFDQEPIANLRPIAGKSYLENWLSFQREEYEQEFDIRQALIESLRTFFQFTNLSQVHDLVPFEPLLASFQILYDGLIDDDESIRETAAATVWSIISNGRDKLSPVATCQPFIKWQVQKFGDSPQFAWLVVSRLTGYTFNIDQKPPISGVSQLEKLKKDFNVEKALFVEEEQNLFIDKVRELRHWKDAALQLPLNQAFEIETLQSRFYGPWTSLLELATNGLRAINNTQRDFAELSLHWTSRPKAFSAALRYIISAEIVLNLYKKHADILTGAMPDDQDEREWRELWARGIAEIEDLLTRCQTRQDLLHPMLQKALAGARPCPHCS